MMPPRLSDGSYYFRFSSGPIGHPCGCRDWLELDAGTGEWVQKHSSCQRHDSALLSKRRED